MFETRSGTRPRLLVLTSLFVVTLGSYGCSSDKSGSKTSSGGSGGGSSSASGGSALAGATSGGSSSGGSPTAVSGGSSSGGSSSGGSPTAVSGGSNNGGSNNGGSNNGGSNNGGSVSSGGSTTAGGNTSASGGSGNAGSFSGGSGGGANSLSFFVTSDTSKTGNLGGLKGADQRCQALAQAVGAGNRSFHAYLSADSDPDSNGNPVNARDRIGKGPWYNSKGVLLANDLTSLHMLTGNADLFIDENGAKIPGQWAGSPPPLEHDILTGSNADGTLAVGKTCMSWTSAATTVVAVVGHSDGLGPGMATTGTLTSWNSAHDNMDCSDTAPRGGAGRLYCFAVQ